MIRAVVFDVGATLVREDRYWNAWADWVDVPRHTLSALVGAVVALGMDDAEALRMLKPGIDITAERAAMEAAGEGERLDDTDLYQDVRRGLRALSEAGMRVYVAGNQTARAAGLLRALDLPVNGVATSGEWGVAKPQPAFFERVLDMTGTAAHETVYVGDFPDNDVIPAKALGLQACHLRRGPWGHLWANEPATLAAADWRVDSLLDLPALLAP
ncbi:HAD family hydrolase [Wenjunlia tyrosinilytica]|uniref:Haloacid dehalogenase n=1 Tax=Wenjunlia tyrosinilytica TaxID=1544741 RepID=A0A917ZCA4_9ACTN|nr:HAD family hydrolase [Wenjunlia tyrosinilytica]GGO80410.1 haloacid dehalogenase [Wenjunlia tyrosinilytica]